MTAATASKSGVKPNRRQFLAIVCGFFWWARLRHAFAQSGTGNGEPKRFAIAVPSSDSPTSDEASWRNIAQSIASDLAASGRFAQIETDLSHQDGANPDIPPQFEKWRGTPAEWLIVGRASQPDQRLKVEFRVWNVATGQQVLGQAYFTEPEKWKSIPHIAAREIFYRLTGEHHDFEVVKQK